MSYHNISENFRRIVVGNQSQTQIFKSNKVVTARYTPFTWAPKSLIMQFKRINNVYFLIMSVLSFMSFSPKSPFSLAGTLAIVLVFTMFKEGYEDIARHQQDRKVNSQKYLKFNFITKNFELVESQFILVGDILKINENEEFPADLLMVGNSNPKGIAFVNTMNLDGETNLKEKVLAYDSIKISTEEEISALNFELQVDQPNLNLNKWNCNVIVHNNTDALSLKQLLLRGCLLKNTDWVYGIAIYTGEDSKIVMNSKKPPTKISTIQKKMNWILGSVFILQILICFIFAGIGQSWLVENDDASYIDLPSDNGKTFILKVLTYWVGYSHMIPISLYVALEIVRLLLANFIKSDILMYSESTDRPAACRASDLIEELGQVQFVFSDKTGTLTCNEMIFRKCGINETIYGSLTGRIENDEHLQKVLHDPKHEDYETLNVFCLMLALCNSVFPARHNDQMVYQASSPDELALVEAGKALGYVLIDRIEGKVFIKVKGVEQVWELITEIPFNSDRKRMSVVVKAPDGKILLFTKGADTKMVGLITSKGIPKALGDLHDFAVQGLRTLVFAYREVPIDEYYKWEKKWKDISVANSPDKDQQLDDHAEFLELSLALIGTSAIEDKLQDGVPETIKILIDASIRVWVLTGDKEETAIEIAKSCNLIQPEMEVFEIFTHSAEETNKRLEEIMKSRKINQNMEFSELETIKNTEEKPMAIVINGLALSFVLESNIKSSFFRLGFISSSCICCRVSPSQKMYVVRLAKTYGSWISLAIGDGANDVSMIQEANIGVGIAGKEGTQAVQAAEFTFTEFKSLSRLLLIHGRLAYLRITLFILYYFYKNFISVFTEFWFALFNGFSGQIYFLDWLPSMYNVFWTSWPCMTFCTLERDLDSSKCLEYPGLYSAGQKGAYFGVRIFWKWVVFAFMSACWIYWLPVVSCEAGSESEGRMPGLFWVSTVSFIMLIHTVNLKLLLVSFFWPGLSMFTILLSFLLFYFMTIVLNTVSVSRVFQPEFAGLFFEVLGNFKTWVVVLLGSFLALVPDFIYNAVQVLNFPNPAQEVRLHVRKGLKINNDG